MRHGFRVITGASLILSGLLAPGVRAASLHSVFNRVAHASLRPTPLWPSYLPGKVARANWSVETLRGNGLYGRTPLSSANGFELYYSYPFKGEFGTGGLARTSQAGLKRLIESDRLHDQPRPHSIELGGRKVLKVYPEDTEVDYTFAAPGAVYVFESHYFGGPSARTVGQMIASMAPITELSVPS
jgi:hypothetical protein